MRNTAIFSVVTSVSAKHASSHIHRMLGLLWFVLLTVSASAFETVVIDPGHGGNDEGTEWRQATEKDLTLAVARRLEKILREKHIQTVLTRHCDAFISLDERAEIANLFPGSLLLSIHFNGSRMFNVNGFEIFAFRHSPTSRTIAESIQQAMMENLRSKNRGIRTDQDYAVLVRSAGSAVLVECGFISNKAEAARLTTPEGQQALAEAIALGVMRIKPVINTDPPEADIAKCEIHARKHDEALKAKEQTEKISNTTKKVSSTSRKPKSKSKKK